MNSLRRKFLLLLALMLGALPALANWIEARSPHFVMLSEDAPEQLSALAKDLEHFDQAARHLYQLPQTSTNPVTIYIADRNTVEQLVGAGAAGAYLGRASGSMVIARRDSRNPSRALFHEYTHHLLQSHYAVPWPFWLSEGSAELLATANVLADGCVEIGSLLPGRSFDLEQLQYLQLPPLLQTSDARLRSQPALSYARSWLLMHYLIFEPTRQGQLARYLESVQSGLHSTAAARAVFGDLAELDRNLKAYAKTPFGSRTIPTDASQPTSMTLRELSAGEQAVLPHHIRLRVGVNEQRAQQLLPQLRAAAAPFAEDAAAQIALAKAELDAGNERAAESAADRALAVDTKRVAALLYKGRAQMMATWHGAVTDPKRWAQVRQWFDTASELAPEAPEPLVLLYMTFLASGQQPTARAVAGLYRAGELAPQDHELRVLLAYQSLVDGKRESARRLLALLAFDPHTVEIAAGMTTVLDRLERDGPAAALKAFDKEELAQVLARF